MVMFLLFVTGILSALLMFRAVIADDNLLFAFAIVSFILSILLTNGVS